LKIKVHFLSQYRGDTKQTDQVHDRFGWAKTEVDLDQSTSAGLAPVLRKVGGFGRPVLHDGVHFWVEIDSTNSSHRGDIGSMETWSSFSSAKEPTKNYHLGDQQTFAWNAFGIKFFDRLPVGHFYTSVPGNMKYYRPGKTVEWDDTEHATRKVAQYLRDNVMIVDEVVMCRIERPCILEPKEKWRDNRVFTPFGGYGDPVLDYAAAQRRCYEPNYMTRAGWKWEIPLEDLAALDSNASDPIARSVRAVFMNLFTQRSWLAEQTKTTKSKAMKTLKALHEVWKIKGPSLETDHLDDIAASMLTISDEGKVRTILEAWGDRPIAF
jgi:hypothetical protein